jgi:hypothetical protein
MATHSGHEGLMKIGVATVAEVTGFTTDQTTDTIEDTELSDTHKTFLAGQQGWTGSCEGHLDVSDATGQELMKNGDLVAVIFYPIGEAAGDITLTGSAYVNSLSRNNSSGATVTASWGLQGTGELVEAVIV